MFASMTFPGSARSGSPKRPRVDPASSTPSGDANSKDAKGLNKKQADNSDYRTRQEESLTKTTIKFVKGNPSHLVKYLQEANGAYAWTPQPNWERRSVEQARRAG